MKILSRYVFREILTSSFLATALATFVILLKGLPDLFGLLVRSAKGPAVIELFILALPPILLLSIPFGVLVGILVGLGRLSSDNEIIAMRSGGVSSRIVTSGWQRATPLGVSRVGINNEAARLCTNLGTGSSSVLMPPMAVPVSS